MGKDDLARLQLLVQERRLRMEELSTLYRQAVSAHREAMVSYQTVAIQQQLAGIDTCILFRGKLRPVRFTSTTGTSRGDLVVYDRYTCRPRVVAIDSLYTSSGDHITLTLPPIL